VSQTTRRARAVARKAGAEARAAAAAGASTSTIAIDPKLVARIPRSATLFVIARRGSGGPPLAVQRTRSEHGRCRVHISDADAMLPGIRLAEGGPITLIARISASGQPIASSGDLFGEVGYDFARPIRRTSR
jgi:cytochrome c-type biogenesis protein CcmH